MKTRLILDTNLWSYVGDQDDSEALRALLAELDCLVVHPPSILVELMHNPHRDSRRRHLDALLSIRGERLSSEAQLCAEDFVQVVRTRRPNWMRAIADVSTVDKFHRRWTKDWWRWAAEDPDATYEAFSAGSETSGPMISHQKTTRRDFLEARFSSDYEHLIYSADAGTAASYLPGWDGSKVEAWRFDIAFHYWFIMSTKRGASGYDGMIQTMRDWVGSRVDMEAATRDPSDYWHLFSFELAARELCHDWIRAALVYTQLTMKVGPGNPNDAQHSSYLVEADLFLSSDKKLVAALNECRRQANFDLAESRLTDLMGGKRSAVEAIRAALMA